MDRLGAIRDVYREWQRGNYRAGLELYDPGMTLEVHNPIPDAGVYEGLEGLQRYMRRFLSTWDDYETQGLEFELSGPGGAFAFLDTLCGYVVACQKSGERVLPREILSVELQAGAFRPIRKPAGSSDGRRRRPYRFTSVPEVARDYIGLAKSIHKIDTSPWVP